MIAIEPSATMRAQRPSGRVSAIAARVEALPLDDDAVDAAMAMLTVHHWGDPLAGLRELRRVARGPVVILTFDAQALGRFWLFDDYAPELLEDERRRFPAIADIVAGLGGARVEAIPVPRDCRDGIGEAYYARPEAFLDPAVRGAQSVWPRLRARGGGAHRHRARPRPRLGGLGRAPRAPARPPGVGRRRASRGGGAGLTRRRAAPPSDHGAARHGRGGHRVSANCVRG